jgi:hypothetical protein
VWTTFGIGGAAVDYVNQPLSIKHGEVFQPRKMKSSYV